MQNASESNTLLKLDANVSKLIAKVFCRHKKIIVFVTKRHNVFKLGTKAKKSVSQHPKKKQFLRGFVSNSKKTVRFRHNLSISIALKA